MKHFLREVPGHGVALPASASAPALPPLEPGRVRGSDRRALPDTLSSAGAYVPRAVLGAVDHGTASGPLGPGVLARELERRSPGRPPSLPSLRRPGATDDSDAKDEEDSPPRAGAASVGAGGPGQEASRLELTDDADLAALRREGARVTNATVQEVCSAMPALAALSLDGCDEVSDAGMWAVARDAPQLRRLVLAGLPRLTHVGLRSVALRCRQLAWLDISRCPAVDDMGLRVIASGLWGLRTLHMRDCTGVHDGGMVELVRCCRRLTDVDVSRCPFLTDKALLALAAHCDEDGGLRRFAYTGSRFCTDEGFAALAAASPRLTALNLSRCDKLTGAGALAAFVARCRGLETLALDGCRGVASPHVAAAVRGLPRLSSLFVAACPGIKLQGYAAIARHGVALVRLRAGGTPACDDEAARVLADTTPRSEGGNGSRLFALRDLDLSASPRLGRAGVASVVRGYTTLLTLRLDRCKRIKRAFVLRLAEELPLVRPGERWFGLEPVPDAEERAAEIELRQRQWLSCGVLQAWWRGTSCRLELGRREDRRRGEAAVVRLQARLRGRLGRERVRRMRRRTRCGAAASAIQAAWRESADRREAARIEELRARVRQMGVAAGEVQRVWRGHAGRAAAGVARDGRALDAARRAREGVLREEAALVVQTGWRASSARGVAAERRVDARARAAEAARREGASLVLQRGVRCHLARLELGRRREAWLLRLRREAAALSIQCAWRQAVARAELRRRLELAEHARRHAAAVRMQAAWRGTVARHFSAVVRAFAHLRAAEAAAALRIQTRWRVLRARRTLETLLRGRERAADLRGAAVRIQSAYRGLKGRQAADVAREIERREAERSDAAGAAAARAAAAGATVKHEAVTAGAVEALRAEVAVLERRKGETDEEMERVRAQMRSWATEAEGLRHQGAAEIDSSKLTGTAQRYRADWLRTRLVEAMDGMQRELRRLEGDQEALGFRLNDARRRLRAGERVVGPTQDQAARAVLSRRRAAFEETRDRRRLASARIQALWRGHAARSAVRRGQNLWAAVWDARRSCVVYFNAVTQRSRLERPIDFAVWGGSMPPEAAEAEAGAEAGAWGASEGAGDGALHGMERAGGGWFRGWDEGSGAFYWWHEGSGEYRWEAPEAGAAGREAELEEAFGEGEEGDVPARSSGGRRIGSSWWVELYDPVTRAVYYHDERTGESAWSLPPSAVAEAARAEEAGAGDDGAAAWEAEAAEAARAAKAEAWLRADDGAGEPAGAGPEAPEGRVALSWGAGGSVLPANAPGSPIPPLLARRLRQADRERFDATPDRETLVAWVRERLSLGEWLAAREAADQLVSAQREAMDAARAESAAARRLDADEVLRAARDAEALRCIEMLREDFDAT